MNRYSEFQSFSAPVNVCFCVFRKPKAKDVSPNGKKAYTNDDLSAAVTEVKNGKLGTRRASSLYGIPRSTLRNKVFKVEAEDSSASSMSQEEESNDVPSFSALQKQMCHQLNTQDRPLMVSCTLKCTI